MIDGLQRLSTLFQMMGILRDQTNQLVEPLVLTKTKYLPAMEGKKWTDSEPSKSLSSAQQLLIKRSKLDIKIILRESDESAKFELFQRLNTGGASLSDQEIRNAMLVAANKEFYEWLIELANYQAFKDCVILSERGQDERYDVELVLRFVVFRKMDEPRLHEVGDIGNFLTEEMMRLSPEFDKFRKKEDPIFHYTFDLLSKATGPNSFRRYDVQRDKFTGGFLISAFEAVALGLGYHIKPDQSLSAEYLTTRIRKLWSTNGFLNSMGAGVRASQRIPAVVKLGRTLFEP